ncbi:MAG: hypothetical protein H6719_05035 [Sandaracinaceae bacterium]|nr:hypothetical protein [Sandaracinaceae bacterium]
MAHDEHHTPGEPPPVRDDAADSPLWLPAVGLAVLLLGAIFLMWRGSANDGDLSIEEEAPAAEAAGAADEAAEGAAEGGDEAEADHP